MVELTRQLWFALEAMAEDEGSSGSYWSEAKSISPGSPPDRPLTAQIPRLTIA
jgi:hypothetical protein